MQLMVKLALLVRLEAKAGKENEVAKFLKSALPLAQQESTTPVWFALRLGPSTFGIFDAFANEVDRKAHLAGPIAAALMANRGSAGIVRFEDMSAGHAWLFAVNAGSTSVSVNWRPNTPKKWMLS
jgi:quinol monooxygenase YgiN